MQTDIVCSVLPRLLRQDPMKPFGDVRLEQVIRENQSRPPSELSGYTARCDTPVATCYRFPAG
jgi:hypothetical protein